MVEFFRLDQFCQLNGQNYWKRYGSNGKFSHKIEHKTKWTSQKHKIPIINQKHGFIKKPFCNSSIKRVSKLIYMMRTNE